MADIGVEMMKSDQVANRKIFAVVRGVVESVSLAVIGEIRIGTEGGQASERGDVSVMRGEDEGGSSQPVLGVEVKVVNDDEQGDGAGIAFLGGDVECIPFESVAVMGICTEFDERAHGGEIAVLSGDDEWCVFVVVEAVGVETIAGDEAMDDG